MNNQEQRWSEWLAAACRGNSRAYRNFLTEVDSYLQGTLQRKLGADHTEDVIQDILLAIHQARHTWREGEPVLPWLHGIIRYKAADHFRRLYRRHAVETYHDEARQDYIVPEDITREETTDLSRILGELTPRQYALLNLTKIHGLSAAEAALQMGMSTSAVKVAVHRLVKMLQQRHSR